MKPTNFFGALALAALAGQLGGCADDDAVPPAATPIDAPASGVDEAVPKSGVHAATPVPAAREGTLLIAELAEGREAIHAYSLPDLRHTGTIPDVRLGGHVGTLALADGRVIATDDAHQQVIAIGQRADGAPAIVQRADADLGEGASWGCADERLRYVAIASGHEDATTQVANVVALDHFGLSKLAIPMNVVDGATEELHPALAGEPLHLFAGVGGEVRAFALSDVLAGTAAEPVARIPIAAGSHGPVVAHATGAFYIAAREGTGFDGVTLGTPFARAALIPWDVDGRASGRNARPRLAADGRTIYGAVTHSQPADAARWAEREVDLHVADLTTSTSRRLPLTRGIVPKFQLSSRYALFANITAEGDFAILLDVRRDSPTFQQVVARIALPRLANGPDVGVGTTGRESRGSAITPDGRWAFVSHGGEGKVSVIDTEARAVVRTLDVPTSLAGGGYLVATQIGHAPIDTCMR